MTLTALKGDQTSKEYLAFSRWLACADQLRTIWQVADPIDCPFSYNETASMSFLCCAAGRANYLAIADYAVRKTKGAGRCDLWVSDDHAEWAFEFKQDAPHRPSFSRTLRIWKQAKACAAELIVEKSISRYAGLVSSSFNIQGNIIYEEWLNIQREFAETNATFAWEFHSAEPAKNVSSVIHFQKLDL